MPTFTILDESAPTDVSATIDGEAVRVPAADIERALGWTLKPEGFCRDETCLVVPSGSTLLGEDGVDLAQFAGLLHRPLALDIEERAACLGSSARIRADALASGDAPDFALPDLDGTMHALSDQRGKKVLLAVWASW